MAQETDNIEESTGAFRDLFGNGPNAPKSKRQETEGGDCSALSPKKNSGKIGSGPRSPVFGPIAHSRG